MISMAIIPTLGFATAIVGIVVLARQALSWFQRLDLESSGKLVQTLEDPMQLKQVSAPSLFAEPSKSLSIIIPAFNEQDRLPAALDEAISYLESRRRRQGAYFTYEVMIVDDGSSDGTTQTAFSYVRKYGFDTVRLLRLPRNCGKGCAVKQGVLAARGCAILMMDADGATKVADLDKLEAKLTEMTGKQPVQSDKSRIAAVVFGSRHHLRSKAMAKRSWYRNILMHGFHRLVVIVAGSRCPNDTQCGFKLFTRSAAQMLFPNQRLQRWCFDVELTWLAQQLAVPIEEVGVNWTEIPGSKIRVTSIIHMALELAGLEVAYKWLGLWSIRSGAEIAKAMQ